jgi:hypothetical protein
MMSIACHSLALPSREILTEGRFRQHRDQMLARTGLILTTINEEMLGGIS